MYGGNSLERARRQSFAATVSLVGARGVAAFFDKSGKRDSFDFSCFGEGFSRKTEDRKELITRQGNYDLDLKADVQPACVTGVGFLNWYYNCLNLN
jgi:hypothetical protein